VVSYKIDDEKVEGFEIGQHPGRRRRWMLRGCWTAEGRGAGWVELKFGG
jgi:hypothetical protein